MKRLFCLLLMVTGGCHSSIIPVCVCGKVDNSDIKYSVVQLESVVDAKSREEIMAILGRPSRCIGSGIVRCVWDFDNDEQLQETWPYSDGRWPAANVIPVWHIAPSIVSLRANENSDVVVAIDHKRPNFTYHIEVDSPFVEVDDCLLRIDKSALIESGVSATNISCRLWVIRDVYPYSKCFDVRDLFIVL